MMMATRVVEKAPTLRTRRHNNNVVPRYGEVWRRGVTPARRARRLCVRGWCREDVVSGGGGGGGVAVE